MISLIKAWLKSKNITAHTVAGLAITGAGIITFDPAAQHFLIELLKAHPVAASDVILLAGIISKYSHSSSAAGTVATAQAIEASDNPPTQSAVEAAKVTKK